MDKSKALQALLSQIRGAPTLDAIYRAYLFALFSIQVPLGRHEKAYKAFIGRTPTHNALLGRSLPSLEVEMRSLGLNLYKTKARALHMAHRDLFFIFREGVWQMEDKEARHWVAENLPGLSYAKASFFMMLLGRMGVGCLDVHMLRLLKTGRVAAPKTRAAYEKIEAKLGDLPGLSQWLRWIDYMGIPGVGHLVYFESQGVL